MLGSGDPCQLPAAKSQPTKSGHTHEFTLRRKKTCAWCLLQRSGLSAQEPGSFPAIMLPIAAPFQEGGGEGTHLLPLPPAFLLALGPIQSSLLALSLTSLYSAHQDWIGFFPSNCRSESSTEQAIHENSPCNTDSLELNACYYAGL